MAGTEDSATSAEVVLGVDTHLDVHVAVALDQWGRRLGALTVPTTAMGYKSLVCWAEGFGPVRWAGVEGTGSYGAGLARHFKTAGIAVMEVERPKRRHLLRNGKSEPLDAEAAARAVLAGETAGEPKSGDGRVEMIRALRTARHSAVKARSQATNQLQALVVTAPEMLRKRLRGLSTRELIAVAARFRLGSDPEQLDRLVVEAAPGLLSLPAIGASHAATLLIVAGDNPERLSSEASFASLCGGSPIEASSGKVLAATFEVLHLLNIIQRLPRTPAPRSLTLLDRGRKHLSLPAPWGEPLWGYYATSRGEPRALPPVPVDLARARYLSKSHS